MEKYFELHPNLVLMDITMPNMDGLEALKAIRAKDSSANVVMCSAMGQEAMVMEAVQAGIKDFIVKPFKARPPDENGQFHSGRTLIRKAKCGMKYWSWFGLWPAICAVLLLSYWFTRYVVAGRAAAGRLKGRHVTVLEEIQVGKDQKLLLVQAGEQICLLGAAPGGITCLRTLNREEMGQWEQEGAPEGACQRISFQEALKSVLQQRRK